MFKFWIFKKNIKIKSGWFIGLSALGIAFIAIIAWGLYSLNKEMNSNNGPKKLPPVQVNQYQGKNLSKIEDFRDVSIKGTQHIDINNYKLQITGLVENPKNYSYQDLLDKFKAYEKVVTLNCVEGWSATGLWEGPLVKDVLNSAKVKPEAKIVIFRAADGYSTSFPIEYIMQKDIILADKLNGLTLPEQKGFPFQLVAEDKWGYKWIKWITQIELSDHVNFRGYWESKGYSNTGDLNSNFFEN